jgi:hypothetical protein
MHAFLHTLVLLSFSLAQPADTLHSYEDEINAWHARRIANLKRDFGWLTLVALDWLKEGSNTVAGLGIFTVSGNTVVYTPPASVKATVGGNTFTGGELKHGAQQDTVRIGSRAFIIIERDHRYAIRMWDTESENRKNFRGIERFPVSPKWQIEATWEPYIPPKMIKVPTVIDGYEQEYPVPGAAVFNVDGKKYRIEPVLEEPDGDYFFIFGDKTNGKETYSMGRFMYTKPASHGKVVLDFNKSYNPPCAFTPYATCPLPPKQNKLDFRVEAGEKKYGDH